MSELGMVRVRPGTAEGEGGSRAWIIWGTAALFYLFEFFVRVAPSVMEPELQKTFHLGAAGLGAALGVYYYVYAPMQLAVGGFLDRFGAKRVLIPAALLCSAGCFLEVAGSSAWLLSMARLLQGFGSAFAFVGTMYLATLWFPAHRLAFLSGLTTALGMLGAIAGNAGIARVVETMGWQVTLRDAGIFGFVVAAAIFFLIPHERPGLAVAIEEEREPQAKASAIQGLKAVFLNPQCWLIGIVGAALYMPLSIFGALWGVQYLSSVTGEDKVTASGAVSMLYVGWLIAGPFAGWLSDRLGRRQILLLGASILTTLTTAVMLLVTSTSIEIVYGLMLLLGIVSSAQVVSFVCAVEQSPRSFSGTAIASTNMMIMLLGGLAQPLVGVILDSVSGPNSSGDYPAHAYRIAMLVLPISSIIGTIAAYFLKESYVRREIPAVPEPMG